jgi:Right handed beta helix region
MMLVAATALALSGALAGMAPAASANDGHNGRRDRHRDQSVVWPGQSIQAAIDAAQPGDTIIVRPGVYHESLEIAANGIRLIGFHAVLEPGATPGGSLCNQPDPTAPTAPTTETGICVHGQINTDTGDVIQTVDNVVIAGFRVNGFTGDGTFVYGGHNFSAFNDEFSHNGGYGIFALHSENVTYIGNLSHDNGDAGFYVGESPNANVDIEHDVSWRNKGEGLLFRDSLGGHVSDNAFTENCVGMLALNTGVPGPGGSVLISDNWIVANNKACPAAEGPPLSGIGLGIAGDTNVVVRHNVINNNNPGSSPSGFPTGGIVIIDTTGLGGSTPDNNTFVGNHLHGNVTNDIFSDGSGTGNVFKRNRCDTSDPAGLCAA